MILRNEFPGKIVVPSPAAVKRLIELAIVEDLDGVGDITSNVLLAVKRSETVRAGIYAKEDGVVCGVPVARQVFRTVSSSIEIDFDPKVSDGQEVRSGDLLIELSGSAQSIVSSERIALNFLGILSGIATKTRRLVRSIEGTKTRLLDTRKTVPGFRELEKYAVVTGGGYNHRIGLYDMILIKDNHIRAVGSVKKACGMAREEYPQIAVEVEVQDRAQLLEALETDCDIVMLDNMDNDEVRESLAIVGGRKAVEASGNVDEKRLTELAALGVDFVSMGALTHTIKPLDISLELDG